MNKSKIDLMYDELYEYTFLNEGWDGYNGAKPNNKSILMAMILLEKLSEYLYLFDTTLDSDGDVIFDFYWGTTGSEQIKFENNGKIIWCILGDYGSFQFSYFETEEDMLLLDISDKFLDRLKELKFSYEEWSKM